MHDSELARPCSPVLLGMPAALQLGLLQQHSFLLAPSQDELAAAPPPPLHAALAPHTAGALQQQTPDELLASLNLFTAQDWEQLQGGCWHDPALAAAQPLPGSPADGAHHHDALPPAGGQQLDDAPPGSSTSSRARAAQLALLQQEQQEQQEQEQEQEQEEQPQHMAVVKCERQRGYDSDGEQAGGDDGTGEQQHGEETRCGHMPGLCCDAERQQQQQQQQQEQHWQWLPQPRNVKTEQLRCIKMEKQAAPGDSSGGGECGVEAELEVDEAPPRAAKCEPPMPCKQQQHQQLCGSQQQQQQRQQEESGEQQDAEDEEEQQGEEEQQQLKKPPTAGKAGTSKGGRGCSSGRRAGRFRSAGSSRSGGARTRSGASAGVSKRRSGRRKGSKAGDSQPAPSKAGPAAAPSSKGGSSTGSVGADNGSSAAPDAAACGIPRLNAPRSRSGRDPVRRGPQHCRRVVCRALRALLGPPADAVWNAVMKGKDQTGANQQQCEAFLRNVLGAAPGTVAAIETSAPWPLEQELTEPGVVTYLARLASWASGRPVSAAQLNDAFVAGGDAYMVDDAAVTSNLGIAPWNWGLPMDLTQVRAANSSTITRQDRAAASAPVSACTAAKPRAAKKRAAPSAPPQPASKTRRAARAG